MMGMSTHEQSHVKLSMLQMCSLLAKTLALLSLEQVGAPSEAQAAIGFHLLYPFQLAGDSKQAVVIAMQAQAASRVKVACMLNLALMEQRSERFSECFSWCNKALRCAAPRPPAAAALPCRRARSTSAGGMFLTPHGAKCM